MSATGESNPMALALDSATARIEALQAELAAKDTRIAELTEALRPFAVAMEALDPSYLQDCDHVAIFDTGADQAIKVGDLFRARNVLNNGCQATASQAESPGSASLPTGQSGPEGGGK